MPSSQQKDSFLLGVSSAESTSDASGASVLGRTWAPMRICQNDPGDQAILPTRRDFPIAVPLIEVG
jgi:hypothetical protein